MDLMDVIHEVAHSYPGGVESLALRMGKKADTLRKKVLPRDETHDLTVRELRKVVDFVDTDRIAQAFADDRGLMCVHKPDFDGLSDSALLDLFFTLQKEQGEWANEISKAMDSGDIDRKELARIRKEYMEFVVAAAEIMSRLETYMIASEQRRGGRPK